MTINDCKLIELPKFLDARGNLSFAENFKQIPFEIKRTYWLYDVPGGENRVVQVEKGRWHSLECQKTGTVLFEAKDGAW